MPPSPCRRRRRAVWTQKSPEAYVTAQFRDVSKYGKVQQDPPGSSTNKGAKSPSAVQNPVCVKSSANAHADCTFSFLIVLFGAGVAAGIWQGLLSPQARTPASAAHGKERRGSFAPLFPRRRAVRSSGIFHASRGWLPAHGRSGRHPFSAPSIMPLTTCLFSTA